MHFFDTLDIWTIKSISPYYIYYKKRVFAFFENKKILGFNASMRPKILDKLLNELIIKQL